MEVGGEGSQKPKPEKASIHRKDGLSVAETTTDMKGETILRWQQKLGFMHFLRTFQNILGFEF